MKTDRFLTPSRKYPLAAGIGTQLAAVLLAVLVTPSTLPTRNAHPESAPPAFESGGTRSQ